MRLLSVEKPHLDPWGPFYWHGLTVIPAWIFLRKKLKNLDPDIYQLPVYFQDDLTARRAKMAYQARKCRNDKKILDTWVIDSKIMVKDLHNRIHQIRSPKDMEHFTNA